MIFYFSYICMGNTRTNDYILKKIEMANYKIEKISTEIMQRQKVYQVNEGKFPVLKSTLLNKGFNKFARATTPFHVDKEIGEY